ncbi:MAG: KEOPS complex N(6)-L-threonylcarbamoyladenine synthase Kae1 [Sulfolobales archaeon]|nr:KEOPS complex N(6)-L-threonylcarbamoyladenine synthase Kae1 [Sulfolobales archaeon]MCX8209041.1 KEOPS complex N(6)-L-threonylcarbamoyladenine synthase Kae1 [Sulfolobales archaeon]MDW8010072.1 KEOPS complex N(6)-L-threonylcarbamoyladenine synthase Kae1 [Sulfolobales archaeon]
MVLVLGIESTAHTFGVGIVSDEPRILADSRFSYVPSKGGIHPREAADSFIKNAPSVLREALSQAKVAIDSVDAVAVALGPGLGPCLRVGATIARALSTYYGKPLVPVNHAVAHVEIGRMLTGAGDPLVVYISGGNTVITARYGGRYRVFGETLDIALGNFMDTLVRELGLAPPYVVGGVHALDRCAEGGKYVELPYVVKGQDTSYSGLLTAALRAYRSGVRVEDVCFSAREVAYSSLVEVAERGLAQLGKSEILLVGGVAASRYLVEKFRALAEYRGVKLYVVPPKYAVDNGVMIAWTGLLMFKHGVTVEPENASVKQRWRLDSVDIYW